MNCDCGILSQDLVNLSKDILVKGDGRPQWEVFEQFCKTYKRKDTRRSFPYRNIFCSQKICAFLARKLNEFMRLDMALSTLLMDLLTIMYFEVCARRHVQRLCDTSFSSDRETLRGIGALRGWLWSKDFMKLLLNFGFFSSLPVDSPYLMKALDSEFETFIMDIAGCMPAIPPSSLREKVMELVNENFYCIKYCKRMYLVVMALRAVQMSLKGNDEPVVEEFISCLRMYFCATRDSFISTYEVRSILYATFTFINKLHLFDMCCQEFDKLMPECPAKMEPRKLTHLARCQIRQNLNESHLPLPSAIDKLLLPKILKSFLLGEIHDISRNTGNGSSQKSVTRSELELMMSEQCAS